MRVTEHCGWRVLHSACCRERRSVGLRIHGDGKARDDLDGVLGHVHQLCRRQCNRDGDTLQCSPHAVALACAASAPSVHAMQTGAGPSMQRIQRLAGVDGHRACTHAACLSRAGSADTLRRGAVNRSGQAHACHATVSVAYQVPNERMVCSLVCERVLLGQLLVEVPDMLQERRCLRTCRNEAEKGWIELRSAQGRVSHLFRPRTRRIAAEVLAGWLHRRCWRCGRRIGDRGSAPRTAGSRRPAVSTGRLQCAAVGRADTTGGAGTS